MRLPEKQWDLYYLFGTLVASGYYDVRMWERYYSRERWESAEAQVRFLEEDLDGTRKSEVEWCGFPDGGLMGEVSVMGYEEELGSDEGIMFLAAVAAKEIEEALAAEEAENTDGATGLNYAIRSHMLLGVLRAAFETDQARHMDDLKQRVVTSGRLDEKTVGPWMESVLEVIKPYTDRTRPAHIPGWSRLLRLILEENGQLFGRWKQMSSEQRFNNPFKLGPRKDLVRGKP